MPLKNDTDPGGLSRRQFLKTAAASLGVAGPVRSSVLAAEPGRAPASLASGRNRPNVLLVFTDQQPWNMAGYAGVPGLLTPHLDRLARESAVLDRFYAHSPVCSPNRACMLTGTYTAQHGVKSNVGGKAPGLRASARTLGEVFREAGYATGYIGKWHLHGSGSGPFVPSDDRHGFDYWCIHDSHARGAHYMLGDARQVTTDPDAYSSDFLTDRAIEFMQSRRGGGAPFCLALSFPDPHHGQIGCREPFMTRCLETWRDVRLPESFAATAAEAGEDHPLERSVLNQARKVLEKFAPQRKKLYGYSDSPEDLMKVWLAEFYRRVECMDENLGRLLATLKAHGELDNTIVVFTADHGEMSGAHRGVTKSVAYEESARIPCLVRHPATVKVRHSDALGTSVDLLATLCDLAGVPAPAHSLGRSLAPVLRGEQDSVYDSVYLQLDNWRAVRTARAKLVCGTGWSTDYLFRLDQDPTEMRNLAADPAHASELTHLRSALADWTARTTT